VETRSIKVEGLGEGVEDYCALRQELSPYVSRQEGQQEFMTRFGCLPLTVLLPISNFTGQQLIIISIHVETLSMRMKLSVSRATVLPSFCLPIKHRDSSTVLRANLSISVWFQAITQPLSKCAGMHRATTCTLQLKI